MPRHEQVRECCQHLHLAAVLEHAPQTGLLKAELLLDHSERMLHLGADMSFGCFDQIIHPPFRRIRQDAALAWAHGNPEADASALHLGTLFDPLVAGIRIDHCLLTM